MTDEPPILAITPAEDAWLVAKCAHLDRLAADVEHGEALGAPRHRPLVFLDLDDVGTADSQQVSTSSVPAKEQVQRQVGATSAFISNGILNL